MTRRGGMGWLVLTSLFLVSCASSGVGSPEPRAVEWSVEDLSSIGGHPTRILGSPRVIETPRGRAVEFDGIDDGLFVDVHPLAGAARFTAEVIFRPDPGGGAEQRFLHLQETGSSDRVLFETRLTADGRWFLDTYVKSNDEGHTLRDGEATHALGAWYHAALVVDGERMRHYVNGQLEASREIDFRPQGPGLTSIGCRANEVYWFKGAIRRARFTPRVLTPEEFLSP